MAPGTDGIQAMTRLQTSVAGGSAEQNKLKLAIQFAKTGTRIVLQNAMFP
jgi:hypothetical protein